jgi:hypothetical protein
MSGFYSCVNYPCGLTGSITVTCFFHIPGEEGRSGNSKTTAQRYYAILLDSLNIAVVCEGSCLFFIHVRKEAGGGAVKTL